VGKWSGIGGRESAGQGGAFGTFGDARVAVFTVVNAVGVIVDRTGAVVRGDVDPQTGLHPSIAARVHELAAGAAAAGPAPPDGTAAASTPAGNTTLTVVATDVRLDHRSLTQLGRQVHASMARAIQPFHGLNDGDVLFAVSTGRGEPADLPVTALGVFAAELAWDAVLTCWQDDA
jgi:L-aminopeptidase/D-esterase-like protein